MNAISCYCILLIEMSILRDANIIPTIHPAHRFCKMREINYGTQLLWEVFDYYFDRITRYPSPRH